MHKTIEWKNVRAKLTDTQLLFLQYESTSPLITGFTWLGLRQTYLATHVNYVHTAWQKKSKKLRQMHNNYQWEEYIDLSTPKSC